MKFVVSAGEVSGDVHGSYLIREISKLSPSSTFAGMGSGMMRSAGADIRFDISPRGTIGIIETIPNLFAIYSTFLKMKRLLLTERPDALILIDSQGFNVPLAEYAKKLGIKTIYYIAPQEWLWGAPKGVKKIANLIDLIISIFPAEHKAYKEAGGNSVYFGHPLVDIVKPAMEKEEARKTFIGDAARIGSRQTAIVISLCPGSRTQEINSLLPILLETSKLILKEFPDSTFLIPAATQEIYNKINSIIVNWPAASSVVLNNTYDILNASDLAICTSGTINLEASILGIPNIMVYKLNPLSYWIGKYILKIGKKLKYFSMPNILLNRKLIPEFIQDDAAPENISAAALKILNTGERLENAGLMQLLGSPPVLPKIAKEILRFFA